MAFSAEIRARLGLDSSQFVTELNKVPSMVERIDAKLKSLGVGMSGGKSAKDSADAYQAMFAAEERLAQIQAKRALQNDAGFRQEVVLQREILGLKAQIDKMEAGTTAKLEAQVALESKLLQLETMIAAKKKETAAMGAGAGFGRAAADAQRTVGVLDKMTTKMKSIFSLGNAIKGVFAFFALANIDKVATSLARAISGVSEKEEEGLKRLAELAEEVANKNIARNREMLSDEERLQLLIQDRARLEEKIANNRGKTTEEQVRMKEDELALVEKLNETDTLRLKIIEDQKRASEEFWEKKADIERQFDEAQKKIDEAAKKRMQDEWDLWWDNHERRMKAVEENRELLLLEAKGVGRLSELEAARYKQLQLITKEKKLNKDIDDLLVIPAEQRTAAEKERLSLLMREAGLTKDQIDQIQKIIDGTKEVTDNTKKTGEAIDSNIEKWKDFKVAIDSVGRGDHNLTDAELARKERQLRQQLFEQELNARTAGGPFTASNRINPLMEQQRSELAGAREEQRLRQNVRQSVDALGFEATLNRFANLTADRIEEIANRKSGEETQVSILKDIRDQQRRGLPTIVLNRPSLTASSPTED